MWDGNSRWKTPRGLLLFGAGREPRSKNGVWVSQKTPQTRHKALSHFGQALTTLSTALPASHFQMPSAHPARGLLGNPRHKVMDEVWRDLKIDVHWACSGVPSATKSACIWEKRCHLARLCYQSVECSDYKYTPSCQTELGLSVLQVLTPEQLGEGLVRLPKGPRNALSPESSSIWGMEHHASKHKPDVIYKTCLMAQPPCWQLIGCSSNGPASMLSAHWLPAQVSLAGFLPTFSCPTTVSSSYR